MIEQVKEELPPVVATAVKFLTGLEPDPDFDKEKSELIEALNNCQNRLSAKTLALFLNFVKIYSQSLPQKRQSGFFKLPSYAVPDNLTSFERKYLSGFEKVPGYQNLQTLLAIYGWIRNLSWQFDFEEAKESSISASLHSIEKWSNTLSLPVEKSEGNLMDFMRGLRLQNKSYSIEDFAKEDIRDYLSDQEIKNLQKNQFSEEEIRQEAYKKFVEQASQAFLSTAYGYNQSQKDQLVNRFSKSGQELVNVFPLLVQELFEKNLLDFDNMIKIGNKDINYYIDERGYVCLEFSYPILAVRNSHTQTMQVAETEGNIKNSVKMSEDDYQSHYRLNPSNEPLFQVTANIVLSPHQDGVKPVLQNLQIQSNLTQLSPFAWSGDPLEYLQKQTSQARFELKQ